MADRPEEVVDTLEAIGRDRPTHVDELPEFQDAPQNIHLVIITIERLGRDVPEERAKLGGNGRHDKMIRAAPDRWKPRRALTGVGAPRGLLGL